MLELNWLELPAGDELDRIVAEALGWRMELRPDSDPITLKHLGPQNEWVLVRNDGADQWHWIGFESDWPSVDEAWEHTFQTYEGCDSTLPLYSRYTDQALRFLDELGTVTHCIMLARLSPEEGWICSLNSISGRSRDISDGRSVTLAHAIVRAGLYWKDAQNG